MQQTFAKLVGWLPRKRKAQIIGQFWNFFTVASNYVEERDVNTVHQDAEAVHRLCYSFNFESEQIIETPSVHCITETSHILHHVHTFKCLVVQWLWCSAGEHEVMGLAPHCLGSILVAVKCKYSHIPSFRRHERTTSDQNYSGAFHSGIFNSHIVALG